MWRARRGLVQSGDGGAGASRYADTAPPQGAEPGDVGTLAAFTSDEDAMASAAHVVLPARSLRS
ncbi:hypothetical protein GCM10010103_60050 [Streptomyces paradoxus]|uniref:Uncharacterized protein n=1 Tax=Streptomyces paradoxus TaxID=66375 RepID=A0A7W9TI73_9ACTN|nr:DUF5949 family protein [Streptomyces paradoxus]MBB6080323.1 hypothetical protein [Streptomyces paradoxus]